MFTITRSASRLCTAVMVLGLTGCESQDVQLGVDLASEPAATMDLTAASGRDVFLASTVALSGAGTTNTMSDNFDSGSLTTSVWDSKSSSGYTWPKSGKKLLGVLQLSTGGFLQSQLFSSSTSIKPARGDFVAAEFRMRIPSTTATGELFVVRASDGVPGFLAGSSVSNSVVLRVRNEASSGLQLTGPQSSDLIPVRLEFGKMYRVSLLFKPAANQFRVLIGDPDSTSFNVTDYGVFYYGSSGTWTFRHDFVELSQISFKSVAAPVELDDARFISLTSSIALTDIWNLNLVRLRMDLAANKGNLTRFYRGTQLQAQGMLETGTPGWVPLGLKVVPTAWTDAARSFRYTKRPYDKEVLFADTLSFVRFAGGWITTAKWGENTGVQGVGDLAYLENGVIKYQIDKIKARIDPYYTRGYKDLIFSIDNVPYTLAAPVSGEVGPSVGVYGQNRGPRDATEWATVMETIAKEMLRVYPNDALRWRFRVSTEPNCMTMKSTHTYRGTNLEYRSWYTSTEAGVKKAFNTTVPLVGPGEFAGNVDCSGIPASDSPVDFRDLSSHCAAGNCQIAFIANSSHAIPAVNAAGAVVGSADPYERARSTEDAFRMWTSASPSLTNVDKYVFQFGILQSELQYNGTNVATPEPGGRGAAWFLNALFEIWERTGVKGIWNWGVAEDLNDAATSKILLMGQGWLYTVLDNLAGNPLRTLPTARNGHDTKFKTLFVTKGSDSYVLVSAFDVDRNHTTPTMVSMKIPVSSFPTGSQRNAVSWTVLTEDNAVHRAIRDGLAAGGMLEPKYAAYPGLLGPIRDMATRANTTTGTADGFAWVRNNYATFAAQETELLTLKPFGTDPAKATFTATTTEVELRFELQPSSVAVIRIN